MIGRVINPPLLCRKYLDVTRLNNLLTLRWIGGIIYLKNKERAWFNDNGKCEQNPSKGDRGNYGIFCRGR